MTDKGWSASLGADPFDSDAGGNEDAYAACRTSSRGWVRDLKVVPMRGSGEPVRFVPYIQSISIELKADETQICLMCHTSGQLIFITGQALGDVAEQISAKRAQSLHVFDETSDGTAPKVVITSVTFDRSFSDNSH